MHPEAGTTENSLTGQIEFSSISSRVPHGMYVSLYLLQLHVVEFLRAVAPFCAHGLRPSLLLLPPLSLEELPVVRCQNVVLEFIPLFAFGMSVYFWMNALQCVNHQQPCYHGFCRDDGFVEIRVGSLASPATIRHRGVSNGDTRPQGPYLS